MPNQLCIHCYVSGKVQGVWFRAATKEQADQLAITGWTRNLPDGRVEVLACGSKDTITQFHTWLKHGPRLAEVKELTCEELPWEEHQGFVIS